MEKIRSLFRKCSCFSSSPSPFKNDIDDIDVDQHHAKEKVIRSPTPSRSRKSLKNNTSIVLAHGAFHTTWHYQLFCDAIQNHTSIDRIIVPQQSSSSSNPPPNSFEADIKLLHNTIASELQEGRDVLLICHSYGGIPGCEALANLPTTTNTTGRILGIVFVTAFVAEAGQSLITSKLAGRASWVNVNGPLSHVLNPLPTLYNTTSPPTFAQECVVRLTPQASASFMTTTQHETWKDYPCYYIRCENDQAMVVEEQNFFIARLKRFCPETTRVRSLESDHAPFASVPEKLAGVVEEIVGELEVRG